MNAQRYYTSMSGMAEEFVYDASFIKLKELSLGYSCLLYTSTVMNMGNYAHGNQPIQHMIYLYDYAGQPWKAQYWFCLLYTSFVQVS